MFLSRRCILYFSTTNWTNHTNEEPTVFLFVQFVLLVVKSFLGIPRSRCSWGKSFALHQIHQSNTPLRYGLGW